MNIKQTSNGVNGQTQHVPSLFAKATPAPVPALQAAQGYVVSESSRLEALLVAPGGRTYVVTGALEVVTPTLAEKYLAGKRPNRKSSAGRVAMYAREMAAGQWMPASQGIALDAEERLIDGEHRLRAVIESGAAVILFVMRGLPTATQRVVDGGRARGAGDQMNIERGSTDGKTRVAVAKVIHMLRTGWLNSTEAMSTRETFDLVSRHAPEIEWALAAFSCNRRVAPATVIGAWAYAYGATPKVGEWVESYLTGAGLDARDPLLKLRNMMLDPNYSVGGSSGRMDIALKAARALWAKHQGQPLSKIYGSTEGVLGFASLSGDDIARAWDWHTAR